MRPRNRGVIIQVGSALAYRAIPLQASYCAAKHAVRAFTDSLRSELVHDGGAIQLTMVHLPALNTPQFIWCRSRLPRHPKPVGRIFQPEGAAEWFEVTPIQGWGPSGINRKSARMLK
jgi:NAD(P)-dependent dehydrogenase (short-subunit alcohol dehydrogenase family)